MQSLEETIQNLDDVGFGDENFFSYGIQSMIKNTILMFDFIKIIKIFFISTKYTIKKMKIQATCICKIHVI